MAIKKVWIETGCIVCMVCEDACPDVFMLKGSPTVKRKVSYDDYENQIKEIAENCPQEVIKYIE